MKDDSRKTLVNVDKGQDPYSVISNYILNHVTAIEDMIAVIQINGLIIKELCMVGVDDDAYFYWDNDWWECEEDVALLDFFPVSDAERPDQWNEFSPDDERLKDHYFYLISHKDYDTPIKAKWHEEGYWTEPFTRETLYWRHDEGTKDNVSAWMYLPEKYKEEREE